LCEQVIFIGFVFICPYGSVNSKCPLLAGTFLLLLVVEDEPLVRMTAADELEEAGFQVLEVTDADEALKVLEARSDEVQVLFTGGHLPVSLDGLGGPHGSTSAGRMCCC
jgi:hypothetical protein